MLYTIDRHGQRGQRLRRAISDLTLDGSLLAWTTRTDAGGPGAGRVSAFDLFDGRRRDDSDRPRRKRRGRGFAKIFVHKRLVIGD